MRNFLFQEDLLSVWNRTATDVASTSRIRDTLRRILNLPPTTPMEYKIHCDCLKYIKSVPQVDGGPTTLSSSSSNNAAAASSSSTAQTTVATTSS